MTKHDDEKHKMKKKIIKQLLSKSCHFSRMYIKGVKKVKDEVSVNINISRLKY